MNGEASQGERWAMGPDASLWLSIDPIDDEPTDPARILKRDNFRNGALLAIANALRLVIDDVRQWREH